MAIISRWRWPPETSCGILVASTASGSGSCTDAQQIDHRSRSWPRRLRECPRQKLSLPPARAQRRLPLHHLHRSGVPMVKTGLNEVNGSCGTKVMSRPRTSRARCVRHRRSSRFRPSKYDLAALDPCRIGRQDAEDGARQRRLAASPNSPTRPTISPGLIVEIHAVEHARAARIGEETTRRSATREQASLIRGSCGSWDRECRASPSPSRLKPITTRKIASPGAVAYHQASGRNSRLSAIVRPHSGVGGGGPRPRKPSVGRRQDGAAHADGRAHDDGRGNVRQDVQHHHPPRRGAERDRRLDDRSRSAQRPRLGIDETRPERPVGERQREDDVLDGRARASARWRWRARSAAQRERCPRPASGDR